MEPVFRVILHEELCTATGGARCDDFTEVAGLQAVHTSRKTPTINMVATTTNAVPLDPRGCGGSKIRP